MYDSVVVQKLHEYRALHTSGVRKGLEEFFDLPENWVNKLLNQVPVILHSKPENFFFCYYKHGESVSQNK